MLRVLLFLNLLKLIFTYKFYYGDNPDVLEEGGKPPKPVFWFSQNFSPGQYMEAAFNIPYNTDYGRQINCQQSFLTQETLTLTGIQGITSYITKKLLIPYFIIYPEKKLFISQDSFINDVKSIDLLPYTVAVQTRCLLPGLGLKTYINHPIITGKKKDLEIPHRVHLRFYMKSELRGEIRLNQKDKNNSNSCIIGIREFNNSFLVNDIKSPKYIEISTIHINNVEDEKVIVSYFDRSVNLKEFKSINCIHKHYYQADKNWAVTADKVIIDFMEELVFSKSASKSFPVNRVMFDLMNINTVLPSSIYNCIKEVLNQNEINMDTKIDNIDKYYSIKEIMNKIIIRLELYDDQLLEFSLAIFLISYQKDDQVKILEDMLTFGTSTYILTGSLEANILDTTIVLGSALISKIRTASFTLGADFNNISIFYKNSLISRKNRGPINMIARKSDI